jgi:sulfur-oxidizing protein SoxY
MVDYDRRSLLKQMLGGSVALVAVSGGLLTLPAWAAPTESEWPKEAFSKKKMDEAIATLYGQKPTESDKISLDVPTIAQNGAVVPVTVESSLEKVTSIALFVAKNPFALTASFDIPDGTLPFVSNRLKMAETSDVTALVMADGKLYSTSKNVKVTVGGCGG